MGCGLIWRAVIRKPSTSCCFDTPGSYGDYGQGKHFSDLPTRTSAVLGFKALLCQAKTLLPGLHSQRICECANLCYKFPGDMLRFVSVSGLATAWIFSRFCNSGVETLEESGFKR